MTISQEKRLEITAWATEQAKKDAMPKSMVYKKNYAAWLQSQIWHYEKKAHLKIYQREMALRGRR